MVIPAGSAARWACRVYGHWGTPLLAFPTSGGDEWEMEGQGMVGALAEFIDGGRIKLFSVGSNGDQSFYDKGAHPFHRSWMQRQWDEYIRWEVMPFIHHHCGGLLPIATMGASFGAYHAVNTLFKHPDAVRACFAMSGLYDLRRFMDGALRRQLLLQQPDRLHRRHDRPLADRADQPAPTSTSPPGTARGNTRRSPTTCRAPSATRASRTISTTGAAWAGTTGRTGST